MQPACTRLSVDAADLTLFLCAGVCSPGSNITVEAVAQISIPYVPVTAIASCPVFNNKDGSNSSKCLNQTASLQVRPMAVVAM